MVFKSTAFLIIAIKKNKINIFKFKQNSRQTVYIFFSLPSVPLTTQTLARIPTHAHTHTRHLVSMDTWIYGDTSFFQVLHISKHLIDHNRWWTQIMTMLIVIMMPLMAAVMAMVMMLMLMALAMVNGDGRNYYGGYYDTDEHCNDMRMMKMLITMITELSHQKIKLIHNWFSGISGLS